MYGLVVSERVHRTTAALRGIVLVLGTGVLTVPEAVASVDWQALGLIFGMFILVSVLVESGFFRWVGLHALRAARFRPARVFFLFCVLTAVLAAFMDSITVMIFMGSLGLEASRLLGIRPTSFIVGDDHVREPRRERDHGGRPAQRDPRDDLAPRVHGLPRERGARRPRGLRDERGILLPRPPASGPREPRAGASLRLRRGRGLDPASAIRDLRLLRVSLVVFAFTVTLLVLHQVLDLLVAFRRAPRAALVLMFGGKDMPELVTKID